MEVVAFFTDLNYFPEMVQSTDVAEHVKDLIFVLIKDNLYKIKMIVAKSLLPDSPKNKVMDIKISDAVNTFNNLAFRNFYSYVDRYKFKHEQFEEFKLNYYQSNIESSANYIKAQLEANTPEDFTNIYAESIFSRKYILSVVNSSNVEYEMFVKPHIQNSTNGIGTVIKVSPEFCLSFSNSEVHVKRVNN